LPFLDEHKDFLEALGREGARLRAMGEWKPALAVSQQLLEYVPERAEVQHNLSVCLLAVGQAALALHHAKLAIQIQPDFWQAYLIAGQALRAMGRGNTAGKLLAELVKRYPDKPEIRLVFSELALHEYCEVRMAQYILGPLKYLPEYKRDITLTSIITQLYDRDVDALSLSAQIQQFSSTYLCADVEFNLETIFSNTKNRAVGLNRSSKPRVGFISPQFFVSPVYFFCIGAIRNLAQTHDLVFFHRGSKHDWATEEFKNCAVLWFDVMSLGSDSLAEQIKKQNLDVLFDLGGWMDPLALYALGSRPANKQYKWVGGQSATTGIQAFDGFISDVHQSPLDTHHLYSEPLIFLESGYVSYQAPTYLPKPVMPNSAHCSVGIISNPVKVSRSFLKELRSQAIALQPSVNKPVLINFIDKRYRHGVVRRRILNELKINFTEWNDNIRINFLTPKDHEEYLQHVAALDWVVDTWPYTGGLTTMEALSMGVPCRTRVGQLFCERHTYAHCRYAGLVQADIDVDQLGIFNSFEKMTTRKTLGADSPRLNHQAVADNLSLLISGKLNCK